MVQKIVINRQHSGAFCLSQKAYKRLIELGWRVVDISEHKHNTIDIIEFPKGFYYMLSTYKDELRCHPLIIQVVEELGADACGRGEYDDNRCRLEIVELTDDVEWTVQVVCCYSYESVVEKHRRW